MVDQAPELLIGGSRAPAPDLSVLILTLSPATKVLFHTERQSKAVLSTLPLQPSQKRIFVSEMGQITVGGVVWPREAMKEPFDSRWSRTQTGLDQVRGSMLAS